MIQPGSSIVTCGFCQHWDRWMETDHGRCGKIGAGQADSAKAGIGVNLPNCQVFFLTDMDFGCTEGVEHDYPEEVSP